ncbi:MAG: glycosyl hydrolase family 5 [Bacteroidetes bacterium]|nr:glycosyl hydrolase family 5 [Bacteroidota bacterium]
MLAIFVLSMPSCKKNQAPIPFSGNEQWAVSINKIYNYKNPVQLIGTNALHVFSAGGIDMNNWHLDIAREFVGNMEQQPIMGNVLFDSNGTYLYPLQTIVDSNRANNRITILCPFGWNGKSSTVFSGLMPTQTYWWKDYKSKMAEWAAQFANQPDVWIEVWNEPYRYDRSDGYTDDIWTSDMNSMVSIIRNAGNQNIVLVPCAEQGQDETVLNNKGNSFLTGKSNILFDIHAYEKWLLVPTPAMSSRLAQLQQNKLPILFGETAPMNAGTLMNPAPLLDSIYNRGISVCAWVWKYDSTDQDALLTTQGQPNNTNNHNWGSIFQLLCLSPRKP